MPDKGLEYLVAAFAGITDPTARRDPRIRILGLLRDRQINDFYASIDAFALPSVAESFGIALREALLDVLDWDAATREQGARRAREEFGVESCLDRYAALFRVHAGPVGRGDTAAVR